MHQLTLVTVASSPISHCHCNLPITFLFQTILKTTFVLPPNTYMITTLPSLKIPRDSHCSPDKTQPPCPNGQAPPYTQLFMSVTLVPYSLTSPCPLSAPGDPPPLLHTLSGPLHWAIALLVTAHADLC